LADESPRRSLLERLYRDYLEHEDTPRFLSLVSKRYSNSTLERLALTGDRQERRAAVLALGFLGNYDSNHSLGKALHDEDRVVRMIAENSIREVWFRAGSDANRRTLHQIAKLNESRRFKDALRLANQLIDDAPFIAEAWNQRAIAYFQLKKYTESADDCHQAMEINPYHFGAAVGMGHCYLELSDAVGALESFRRALKLNPDMEDVRGQVTFLERQLEES
jgi:tetratricopeptide (TPR) repeat protein